MPADLPHTSATQRWRSRASCIMHQPPCQKRSYWKFLIFHVRIRSQLAGCQTRRAVEAGIARSEFSVGDWNIASLYLEIATLSRFSINQRNRLHARRPSVHQGLKKLKEKPLDNAVKVSCSNWSWRATTSSYLVIPTILYFHILNKY